MGRTRFDRDEITLCTYAARFGEGAIGGIDAIHALRKRSRSSIRLKIQNIASMLDEAGVDRSGTVSPLSGLPAGERGRQTNWDVVSELVLLSRQEHLNLCERALKPTTDLPGELPAHGKYLEGSVQTVLVNRFERDRAARDACVAHYGTTCSACGLSFGAIYGRIAEGFIHVHHLRSLAEIGKEYTVDPIADLRPVCPNCHAAIHLGGGCRTLEEVRAMLRRPPERA